MAGGPPMQGEEEDANVPPEGEEEAGDQNLDADKAPPGTTQVGKSGPGK